MYSKNTAFSGDGNVEREVMSPELEQPGSLFDHRWRCA
jgi:hypothetical protein